MKNLLIEVLSESRLIGLQAFRPVSIAAHSKLLRKR